MDGGQFPSQATVAFHSARQAGRRIAGVAAAARIVRELSKAGFAGAWLRVPASEALDAATMGDIGRLAGTMRVQIGEPPAGTPVVAMPGDRLIPAEAIPEFLASDLKVLPSAIDLINPGAGVEILRRTGKATDGPVSRWLNRPVSRALSAILLAIPGVRPLHATLGTAALAVLMVAALVVGGDWGLAAGGLLFQAASIFDGVDGEVARATFRSSPAGAALDTAVDMATTVLFIVGLAINLGSRGYDDAFMPAAWGMGLFLLGLALLGWRAALTGGSANLDGLKQYYRNRFASPAGSRWMAFATVVSSRDFFALLFAVLLVAGLPMAPLLIFAAAATVWFPFVVGLVLSPRMTAPEPEKA
jgi:CDP-L-myo-inositol myo-inositolphosphotransferase